MGRGFDTISFLSDYGLEDEFVGVVKAVIRSIAPNTMVIDLTHQIPPHDTRAGALALARSMQYLPSGVVLAVVDPGVGTERRAVAVEVGDPEGAGPSGPTEREAQGAGSAGVLVGPDNGLLAPAVAMAGGARRAVSLDNAEYHLSSPGRTFAGRDILGPVAAHLCAGVDLAELGSPVEPLSLVPGLVPLPRTEDGRVVGEVLWIDRFGNAQLNVDPDDVVALGDTLVVRVGERARPATRVTTFAELSPGKVGLLVDSYGLLAVVLDRRSAAEELHITAGDTVTLEPAE